MKPLQLMSVRPNSPMAFTCLEPRCFLKKVVIWPDETDNLRGISGLTQKQLFSEAALPTHEVLYFMDPYGREKGGVPSI